MTEAEWLAETDPRQLIRFIAVKTSDRKLRLSSVACARQVWAYIEEPRFRQACEVAELFADGLASSTQLDDVRSICTDARQYWITEHNEQKSDRSWRALSTTNLVWRSASSMLRPPKGHAERIEDAVEGAAKTEAVALISNGVIVKPSAPGAYADLFASLRSPYSSLFRCVFGNPFRPVTLDPSWLTSIVTAIAKQMYESRDFSPMPILADALQDAGCDNTVILDHCRGPGPHVRGCWVVDLILQKS